MKLSFAVLVSALAFASSAQGLLLGYGICQAGCASLVVACYSAAGAVFGCVAAVAAPPAILACNSAFGSCQAACVVAGLAPIP
ncbi:hypothetical protein JCM8097_006951 [Rhodosporidiobolus ruineniae]